jgi:hypothetical protein
MEAYLSRIIGQGRIYRAGCIPHDPVDVEWFMAVAMQAGAVP